MKNNNNERGVALIAAVMITAILAGIGISFAFNMKLEEEAAANYLWKTQADAIAQGGIERAIQTIVDRREEEHTFIGTAGVANPSQYGFAPLDRGLGDGLTARSEVVVRDEAGKVNLNASGHGVRGGFANHGVIPGISRGWTTAEIRLPVDIDGAIWGRKFGDGQPGIATGTGADDNVGLGRFGANANLITDGIDNDGDGFVDEANEGVNEPSEFRFLEGEKLTLALLGGDRPFITVGETEVHMVPIGGENRVLSDYMTLYSRDRYLNQDVWWRTELVGTGGAKADINTATATTLRAILLGDDGIDNDGDGLIDELDEQLTRNLVADGIDNDGDGQIDEEDEIIGMARQVAANIIDFRDADSRPTLFEGERGIERTLFINEVWVDEFTYWLFWTQNKMEAVELINPWNVPVSGRYRIRWISQNDGAQWFDDDVTFTNFPARSVRYSYHENISSWAVDDPGGSVRLQVFIDGAWRTIEELVLTNTGRSVDVKNDPRAKRLPTRVEYGSRSFGGQTGHRVWSPSDFNEDDQGFNPRIMGEVPLVDQWAGHFNHFNAPNSPGGRNFHNTGELGYIHTGYQWSTLRMRNVTRPDGIALPHQGRILDRVTINHPYNRIGRINVNTASREVLDTLPQMGIEGVQAEAIIRGREGAGGVPNPFNTIGEVIPNLVVDPDPGAGEPVLNVHVTRLMQWINDAVNWVIQWPSTWGWPLGGIGDNLHTYILDQLTTFIGPGTLANLTITRTPANNPPTYVNFFQRTITTEIVRWISSGIVNVTNSVIDWARNWVPTWFNWRESLVSAYLIPIRRAGEAAHTWSISGGSDEDGDTFRSEDDERETIVRSVSNLITTRSDRFEIISTGSVLRGGETLAESRMRAVVCRITTPVTILYFERR